MNRVCVSAGLCGHIKGKTLSNSIRNSLFKNLQEQTSERKEPKQNRIESLDPFYFFCTWKNNLFSVWLTIVLQCDDVHCGADLKV